MIRNDANFLLQSKTHQNDCSLKENGFVHFDGFLIDVSSFNPRELYSYRLLIIVVFNPYSL